MPNASPTRRAAAAAAIPGLTFLLTLLVALGPLTMSVYTPSMPAIGAGLGVPASSVQATLSIYLAGFALAQLVYGPLSDRYGRRGALLGGLAVYVVGSAMCGLSGSIEMLLAGRLVQSFGACAGPALGRAMVRDAYGRDEAARVLAFIGMALAVAPAVGPVLGGYVQAWFGWQAIFVVLGAAGLLLLAVAGSRLPETNTRPNPAALRPRVLAATYAAVGRHPVFLGYGMVAAVTLGGVFTYQAVAPFLLIDRLGLTPEQYGWWSLVTVGGYFTGSLAINRFGPRLGIDRGIALSVLPILGGAALLLGLAVLGRLSLAAVLGPMMLWGLGTGMALPNAMAGALAPFPHAAGAASALMGCIQMATGAAGSILAARLNDGTARPAGGVLLALALGGYGLWFVLRRRGAA